MLRETNLVGILRVGVVRVDGLRPVRVLGRLRHLACYVSAAILREVGCGRVAESGLRRAAVFRARSAAGVSRNGRRGFETIQLGGRVHLRGLAGGRLGASAEGGGHGSAGALFFVEGERIDEPPVSRLGC